jgi:general secretion pathway protein J
VVYVLMLTERNLFMIKPTTQKGFTLLELILSISILSVVLVTIYGTLSMGSRAWEKGERDIEKIQRERVVMNLLSREIKSIFPYKVTPSERDTHKEFYAFEGKKDSISFVSTAPLKGEKGGLSWLTFWVEDDEGLVVVERDALRADIFEEKESIDKDEMEVLDQQVTAIRFEYYQLKSGKTEGEGEGEWEEKWDAEKERALPSAVRVELTFEEEGRGEDSEGEVYTKELITPLMVQVKKLRGRRSDDGSTASRSTGTRDRNIRTRDRGTSTRDRNTKTRDRSTGRR